MTAAGIIVFATITCGPLIACGVIQWFRDRDEMAGRPPNRWYS